ncbi:MAG TPA: hypothetical protein VK559_02280 [Ferruginibacter sp.]|nr:hypothetical protein [Ferruginibacter sp.]
MTEEDNIIEQIITFLTEEAVGDIRYTIKDRQMAAFILAACFIDLLGAYRYNISKNRKRWAAIIDNYMYPGKGKILFTTLRSDLVHNYSLQQFQVVKNELLTDKHPENAISLLTFFNDLEIAFNTIIIELRTPGSDARKNALAWDKKYPIIK